METINVINHQGMICLLQKAKEADGQSYPFSFRAVVPETKDWAFRLLPTFEPDALDDERLTKKFKIESSAYDADWEERVGRKIGWLTIYPPGGQTGQPQKVKYERGPDLLSEIRPPRTRLQIDEGDMPLPPPPQPEMDIF